MISIATTRAATRQIALRASLVLSAGLACVSLGRAGPPIEPLPVPDYSFDRASSAVYDGAVGSADVLILDFPEPDLLLTAAMLGLLYPEDDLDALSSANPDIDPNDTFALLFSVSSETVGLAPPDPALIDLGVPFNVLDQAVRGHAAGDQFMSTRLYTVTGSAAGTVWNNVLTRNNYDEGGTDFSALPETAADIGAWDDSLDIVDATGRLTRVTGDVARVYYSVTADSPSLDLLPTYGPPSGADIYHNELPSTFTPPTLYAGHAHLNLVERDDIDALIVFDLNENGWFDDPDQVLFSLAPGSPSLDTIFGASSDAAAADVFVAIPGELPALFAPAADFGLGHPLDDLDALEFFLCDDPLACAARHGIRSIRGDLDRDGDVDLDDLAVLLAHYGTVCGAAYDDGDLDCDGDVDLSDLAALLSAYGTPGV